MELSDAQLKLETLTALLSERNTLQFGDCYADDHSRINLDYIKMMLADWMRESTELAELITGRIAVISADINRMKQNQRDGI